MSISMRIRLPLRRTRVGRLQCAVLAGLIVCAAATCRRAAAPRPKSPAAERTAVKLNVLVVGDPAFAAAVERQRGEWSARVGGRLNVVQQSADGLTDASFSGADVVVYPSSLLGELAERSWIVPIRQSVLRSDAYDANDIFSSLRGQATAWAGTTMAVPLGSPLLTLMVRTDILDRLGRTPPETWSDYHSLVEAVRGSGPPPNDANRVGGTWHATIEPFAGPWAGHVLVARAAAYARHRNRYSTLFDATTMEPLIASPPFVRALDEMCADLADRMPPQLDPAGAREALLAGRAAMVLTWPSSADGPSEGGLPGMIGIVRLPGSREVYNAGTGQWERRVESDDGRIPLLGVAGRLGSVTSSSRNAPTASRLLAWLCGTETSEQVSAASRATTLFRRSHVGSASAWVDAGIGPAVALRYARSVEDLLDRRVVLGALRIPGSAEYLEVLSQAVRGTLAGERSPQEALQDASDRWRAITERLGVDSQKQAYAHSLGL